MWLNSAFAGRTEKLPGRLPWRKSQGTMSTSCLAGGIVWISLNLYMMPAMTTEQKSASKSFGRMPGLWYFDTGSRWKKVIFTHASAQAERRVRGLKWSARSQSMENRIQQIATWPEHVVLAVLCTYLQECQTPRLNVKPSQGMQVNALCGYEGEAVVLCGIVCKCISSFLWCHFCCPFWARQWHKSCKSPSAQARSRSVSAKTLKHRDTYTALRHFQYHPDLWTLQMPRSYY